MNNKPLGTAAIQCNINYYRAQALTARAAADAATAEQLKWTLELLKNAK